MVTSAVELADVGSIGKIIGLSVVCASEDTIGAILVQDIGIEELAKTGSDASSSVAGVIGALLGASSGADSGVEWLSLEETLDSHVGVSRGR